MHPALHSGLIPIKDAMVRCGRICPLKVNGKPGIVMSQTCVDMTFLLSGIFIIKAFVVKHLFTTLMPSMIKIDVAPVSAIAWWVAILIAFKYYRKGWAKIHLAMAVIDCTVGDAGGLITINSFWASWYCNIVSNINSCKQIFSGVQRSKACSN